jgi:NADPH:quinone reductase
MADAHRSLATLRWAIMQLIEVTQFGGPEVLVPRQAPEPVPGPGQVVIATAAVDVLFIDTVIRAGHAQDFFSVRPPYVPGNGVAGQVIAIGDQADPGWAGQSVVAHTGQTGGSGGYAEQAVADAADLIPVPPGVSPPEAAALLHDGATAIRQHTAAAIRPGEWVMVTAAAGGMGVLLVQLARAAGGRVVGAARGGPKLAVVRAAGAGAVVDYSEPGWAKEVLELTGGHGADVVFDGAGGLLGRAAFEATAVGGRFFAHGISDGGFAALHPEQVSRRGVTVHALGEYHRESFLREAATALARAADGRLRPVIGQALPLARAAEAHAALQARTAIAKTLLVP